METEAEKLLIDYLNFKNPISNITFCSGGGNNRAFKVESEGQNYLLKEYFFHESDKVNRLKHEISFLRFCEKINSEQTPRVWGFNEEKKIALYAFIEGRKIKPQDVSENLIYQTAEFFKQINTQEAKQKGNDLPLAAEAYFSIKQQIDVVERRLEGFKLITGNCESIHQAKIYILRCENLLKRQKEKISKLSHCSLKNDLEINQRCISPSDFGFHNILKTANGALTFLDFEYAGWDDPGKMIGDFFSQVAIPVPLSYFDLFTDEVLSIFPYSQKLKNRARLLLPIYLIKWVCIVLNVFHPHNASKRFFSRSATEKLTLYNQQLQKAALLFDRLKQIES